MTFADLHIHALYGCDDGPKTEEQMYNLVDRCYVSGTRTLCLTPHYHPGYFGDNREKSQQAFEKLTHYAGEKYPELRLYLGNELRWDNAAVRWLEERACRTMNGGRCVLVDFRDSQSQETIENGLYRLLSAGYVPILAHVERYRSLVGKIPVLLNLREKGIIFQVDAGAFLGRFGISTRFWAKNLMKKGMIDLVCSDAHDCEGRPPEMEAAYGFIAKQIGQEYAEKLCRDNGAALLHADHER